MNKIETKVEGKIEMNLLNKIDNDGSIKSDGKTNRK